MQGIEEQHRTRVIRVLQFLVYSDRPLRIEELVDAVAVDLSRKPEFESNRRMPNPETILKIYPSLLTPTSRYNENSSEEAIKELELVHAKVKEYLTSLGEDDKFHDIFNPVTVYGSITRVCLAYLSQLSEAQSPAEIYGEFPLARYSSRYCLGHASISDGFPAVKEAVVDFLLQKRTREIWGSLYNPNRPWDEAMGQGPAKIRDGSPAVLPFSSRPY